MPVRSVPPDVVRYHGAFVHHICPEDQITPKDLKRQSDSLRKLSSFSDKYFTELSADMFEELRRREDPRMRALGPLGPIDGIHWKRNDARRQVAKLSDARFRDICCDLITEQERRYPELRMGPTYPPQDALGAPAAPPAAAPSAASSGPATPQMQNVLEAQLMPRVAQMVESDSEDEVAAGDGRPGVHTPPLLSTQSSFESPLVGSASLKSKDTQEKAYDAFAAQLHERSSLVDASLGAASEPPSPDPNLDPNPAHTALAPRPDAGAGPELASAAAPAAPAATAGSPEPEAALVRENAGSRSGSRSYDDGDQDSMLSDLSIESLTIEIDGSAARRAAPTNKAVVSSAVPSVETAAAVSDAAPSRAPAEEIMPASTMSTLTAAGGIGSIGGIGRIFGAASAANPSTSTLTPSTSGTIAETSGAGIAGEIIGAGSAREITSRAATQPDLSRAPEVAEQQDPSRAPEVAEQQDPSRAPEMADLEDPSRALDVAVLRARIRELEENLASRASEDAELRGALQRQQEVSEQVRAEATRVIDEMRDLAAQCEALNTKSEALEGDVGHYKDLYESSLAELSRTRAGLLKSGVPQRDLPDDLPSDLLSPSGRVREQDLRACLLNVSKLVENVHSPSMRSQTLESLHAVVLAARSVVGGADQEASEVAVAANALISIVRNYLVSPGLFPTILVDGACADLAASVIEHASTVKVSEDIVRKSARGRGSKGDLLAGSSVALSPAPAAPAAAASPERKSNTASAGSDRTVVNTPDERAGSAGSGTSDRTVHFPGGAVASSSSLPSEYSANSARSVQSVVSNANLSVANAPLAPEAVTGVRFSLDGPRRPLPQPGSNPGGASRGGSGTLQETAHPQFVLAVDESVKKLQVFLEEQTPDSVEAIGALLTGIKENVDHGALKPLVTRVRDLVAVMADETDVSVATTRNRTLQEKGAYLCDNLKDYLKRIDMLFEEELAPAKDNTKPNRQLKQRLAGVSFDMAKSTKELVKTVEDILLREELTVVDQQLE